MLRNTSRAVTKKPIMADQSSIPSNTTTQNSTRPDSPFFGSPRFFKGFLMKGSSSDAEAKMSPNSVLDSKKLINFGNPSGLDINLSKNKPTHSFSESKNKPQPEGICVALIEEKPKTRKVLFGSNLKIQIPSPSSLFSYEFGTKTPNNAKVSASECVNSSSESQKHSYIDSTVPLSLSEMELSEEYTCVIYHGPSPKTTHIYGNCIVKSCCGDLEVPKSMETDQLESPYRNFLSFCHTCKKNIGASDDIYIYRGEKAFCSEECRGQEMILDGLNNSQF